MDVFGISEDASYQIWLGFGEQSEQFSLFFLLVTFLGIYKGYRGRSKRESASGRSPRHLIDK
jgi:hypothetical protein